jgi:hypothetical protein
MDFPNTKHLSEAFDSGPRVPGQPLLRFTRTP